MAARGLAFDVTVTNVAAAVSASKVLLAFVSSETRSKSTDDDSDDGAPLLALWAVRKVHLAAGHAATLTLATNESGWCALCSVDESGVRAVRPGKYRLRFGGDGGVRAPGSCSHDESCAETLLVVSGEAVPQPF
jgi:hypothetical protein